MSGRDDSLPVDADLDALLARVLGTGRLAAEQRRRHLAQLGLLPEPATSGMLTPVTPEGGAFHHTVVFEADAPRRRRRRAWSELLAASLAILLVAGLLVAVFRDDDGGEDDDAPAVASPEAGLTRQERVYAVSHVLTDAGDVVQTAGRVAAYDAATGAEVFALELGARVDGALSPDGRTLFVAHSPGETDELLALDTAGGRVLWRQPIQDRQWYKPGSDPSMLSVSEDNATVSVYSCEGCTGEQRFNDGRNWLQVFDARTGARQPDLQVAECRGQTWRAPAVPGLRPLYVICDRGRTLEIIDPGSGQGLELTYEEPGDAGLVETRGVAAAARSADGRTLYLGNASYITIVDMAGRSARQVQLLPDVALDRRLPLLAPAPDESRLFIGSLNLTALEQGRAQVDQIDVYGTADWQMIGRIETPRPLTSGTIAASPDNRSVYAASIDYGTGVLPASTLLHLSLEAAPRVVTTRSSEEILHLFAGTVDIDPAATPVPTPTPEPVATREQLYVVSTAGDAPDTTLVSAYDAATGDELYAIETGPNAEATLARDGSRLYVVSGGIINSGGQRQTWIEIFDAATGERRSRASIDPRVVWPGNLMASPSGARAFIGSDRVYAVSPFDGTLLAATEPLDPSAADCEADLHVAADSQTLYAVCHGLGNISVFDAEAYDVIEEWQVGGTIVGSAASRDATKLYVLSEFDGLYTVTAIDMNARTRGSGSVAHLGQYPLHSLQLAALSPDGTRFFYGMGEERPGEVPVANQVWSWDPLAMQHGPHQGANPAITGPTLAPAPDNRSVFAVHQEVSGATISLVGPAWDGEPFLTLPGHEVLRLLSGRVELPSPVPLATPTRLPTPPAGCPITPYGDGPPDAAQAAFTDTWFTNGGLWAGLGPEHEGVWSDRGNRVLWWRQDPAPLKITGQRLDGDSPPLEVVIFDGYEGMSHQITTISTLSSGCWSITATSGEQALTFIVEVVPYEETPAGREEQRRKEEIASERRAQTPFPVPDECADTSWGTVETRPAVIGPYAYWLDGAGLSLGQRLGLLVEGQNDIGWLAAPGVPLEDALAARIVLTAERLDGPADAPQLTMGEQYPLDGRSSLDYERAWTATLSFPASGCWHIHATLAAHSLDATVYVYPAALPEGAACPVTPPGTAPPGLDPAAGAWFGGDGLWATLADPEGGGPTQGDNRVLWWNDGPSAPSIFGRRLDGEAGPLRATQGHFRPHWFVSVLSFPSEGCWEVIGANGEAMLTFVVEVGPMTERVEDNIRREVETERRILSPSPIPDTCQVTGWTVPKSSQGVVDSMSHWLEGDGIRLAQVHGLFFTGDNWAGWMVGPDLTADEALDNQLRLSGQRLDGPGGQPVLELPPSAPAGTVAIHSDNGEARGWSSTVSFQSPGCWQIRAELLEFSLEATIYVYPAPGAEPPAGEAPAPAGWNGPLYAFAGGDVVQLDSATGEVVQGLGALPAGDSPFLALSPAGDRLAVSAYLPFEDYRLDVLIYRTEDWRLERSVPVPRLIQSLGGGQGLAFSADGRHLHVWQYEVPPGGSGDNARYWLGTFDIEAGAWLPDVEVPGCQVPQQLVSPAPGRLLALCNGIIHVVDIASQSVVRGVGYGQQVASFTLVGETLYAAGADRAVYIQHVDAEEETAQRLRGAAIEGGARVVPFMEIAVDPSGRSPAVPTATDADRRGSTYPYLASEIAIIDLEADAVARTIRPSAPFSDIAFAPDGSAAFVALVDADAMAVSLARIDLATGHETPLYDGPVGSLLTGP